MQTDTNLKERLQYLTTFDQNLFTRQVVLFVRSLISLEFNITSWTDGMMSFRCLLCGPEVRALQLMYEANRPTTP